MALREDKKSVCLSLVGLRAFSGVLLMLTEVDWGHTVMCRSRQPMMQIVVKRKGGCCYFIVTVMAVIDVKREEQWHYFPKF